MLTDSPSDNKLVTGLVADEFRVLNAQMPRKRKSLAELLDEDHPHVMCNDGSTHLFKKKELLWLKEHLDEEEHSALFLPIILEVTSNRSEIIIRTKGRSEVTILSQILDMPVESIRNTITLFRPQLTVVRKVLKTTTQYLFAPAKD